MNTIPLTFNENLNKKLSSYTVIGGSECKNTSGISAIIINSPGHPRRQFFRELEKSGFDSVISIESSAPRYDIEELSSRFPFVRFILPENEINLGAQINLAVYEIESPLFFVLRSDTKIIAGGLAKRMAERLGEINKQSGEVSYKRLCTVPVIMNPHYEPLPLLRIPVTIKKKMRTSPMYPYAENQLSLYPYEGIGIYDRRRFIEMGGFDMTLKNTYWQFLDFGFRAYLWGEEIALSLHLKLICEGDITAEDHTMDKSYSRFFLKNMAPVFNGSHARLPLLRYLSYFLKSGEDIFSAWEEFSKCSKWVNNNKHKWKKDVRSVTNLWENAAVPTEQLPDAADLSDTCQTAKMMPFDDNTEPAAAASGAQELN